MWIWVMGLREIFALMYELRGTRVQLWVRSVRPSIKHYFPRRKWRSWWWWSHRRRRTQVTVVGRHVFVFGRDQKINTFLQSLCHRPQIFRTNDSASERVLYENNDSLGYKWTFGSRDSILNNIQWQCKEVSLNAL